ncbi:hypothetical protein GCM10023231_11160 [Olivibacter ginsenosidimutans]|uniref:Uncharacterized protein n=1 Tax=Olivibacter ginsenosidimutans TaxID=1176537 RepID=A0ABP9ASK7_9SPHI
MLVNRYWLLVNRYWLLVIHKLKPTYNEIAANKDRRENNTLAVEQHQKSLVSKGHVKEETFKKIFKLRVFVSFGDPKEKIKRLMFVKILVILRDDITLRRAKAFATYF